jgi:hypothetical protein
VALWAGVAWFWRRFRSKSSCGETLTRERIQKINHQGTKITKKHEEIQGKKNDHPGDEVYASGY